VFTIDAAIAQLTQNNALAWSHPQGCKGLGQRWRSGHATRRVAKCSSQHSHESCNSNKTKQETATVQQRNPAAAPGVLGCSSSSCCCGWRWSCDWLGSQLGWCRGLQQHQKHCTGGYQLVLKHKLPESRAGALTTTSRSLCTTPQAHQSLPNSLCFAIVGPGPNLQAWPYLVTPPPKKKKQSRCSPFLPHPAPWPSLHLPAGPSPFQPKKHHRGTPSTQH
jgi:hypothetical protein